MNDNDRSRNAVDGELDDEVSSQKMSCQEDDAPSSQLQEEEVQPSSMLIDILHHKLRDPSIVRKFESSRQDSSTYGLICPRWVLQHAKGDVANDKESKPSDNTKLPNCRETVYNSYPKRNYIDLRMEQNRMFANEQHKQCKALLSKLSQPSTASQSTPSSNNNDINNNNKQWKKQADTIQSLLNEGLTSCPNHVGLLQAEKEYKEWIQQRINILSTPSLPTKQTTAAIGKTTPSNSTLLPNSYAYSNMKKGAENRAQAALRDAQLERSFMLDGDNAKDDKKDDNNNMYPLLSANDDDQQDIINGIYNNKEGSLSSGSDTDEDSRRRTKSKHKYKKHKRSKSRHGHDGRRRKRRSSRRSRSKSSRSSSSSQSSDSYRRRKHSRRKEKKRRKKKKRRRHRESRSTRYSSEEDDDDGDKEVDTEEDVKDDKTS